MPEQHHHHHHSTSSKISAAIQEALSPLMRGCGKLVLPSLLFVLAMMPWFYNGGDLWWLPLFQLLMLVICVMWLLGGWWCGWDHLHFRWHKMMWLFLIPLGLGVLQLIPCAPLVRLLSPATWDIWSHFNEAGMGTAQVTFSLSPDATLSRISLLFTCALVFLVIRSQAQNTMQLRLVLFAIIAAALGNAFYSFVAFFQNQVSMGIQFSGTFQNRNHFAFLMMLGILATVALFPAGGKWSHDVATRYETPDENKQDLRITILLFLTLFTLIIAQLLSLSRGGFTATISILAVYIILRLLFGHNIPGGRRQQFIVLALLVACALIFALPWVIEKLSGRFSEVSANDITLNERWYVCAISLKMLAKFWLTGTGLGAYSSCIQPFEEGRFTYAIIDHAHNDIVELLCEIGIPFGILLLVLLLTLWGKYLFRAFTKQVRYHRWIAVGTLLAVPAALFHEFVDFNLQAWSNAILFTAMLATGVTSLHEHSSHGNATELHHRNREGRFKERLVLLAGAILLLALLPWQIRSLRAAIADSKLYNDLAIPIVGEQVGKRDIERRLDLVNTAKNGRNGSHTLMERSSKVHVSAAKRMDDDQDKHWLAACRDADLSCQREPGDGATALLSAQCHEEAFVRNLGNETEEQLAARFAWASSRYPTVERIIRQCALAAYRRYFRAAKRGDPASETLRQATVEQLAHCLALQPNGAPEVFQALTTLERDYKRLLEIVPDTYPARSQLARHLRKNRRFEDALNLNKMMLLSNETSQSFEYLKEPDLRQKRKLSLLNESCILLELTAQFKQRQKVWLQRTKLEHDNLDLSPVQTALDNVDFRRAKEKLLKFQEAYRLDPAFILMSAHVQDSLGNRNEMLTALLPLAYLTTVPPTREQIEDAQKLLKHDITELNASLQLRARFIKDVLAVLALEIDAPYDANALQDLKALVQEIQQGQTSWLQAHLPAYFLGRAFAHQQETAKAVEAFATCLANCPTHFPSILALAKLEPNRLTPAQNKLVKLFQARAETPVSPILPGVTWLATEVSPNLITDLHANQNLTFYFLCTSDLEDFQDLKFNFSDSTGNLFSHDLKVSPKEMLTWRVGQVIDFSAVWQPIVRSLSARRMPRNDLTVISTKGPTAATRGWITALH
ncbi:MAG: O-antigen ligase family protein [Victivallales bacterium]|nr:O-antigen ligase family protein [Victivallales bacterium]